MSGFFTFVFIGMLWLPGHPEKDVTPDEFYSIPVATMQQCMKLEDSFEKSMEAMDSQDLMADEHRARWTQDCRVYLTGNGKDQS